MISSKFISNMRSILNNNHSRKELLDYEKEKEYYTEYEKEIIHLILEIDNDMEIFTYKDNPYEFLGKIDILEDDLRKILTEIKEVELKAKICDYLWINFKNYECSKEAYSIYIKLANDKKINSEIQFCYLVRAFGIFIDTGRKKEQLENIKQAILYYLSENINVWNNNTIYPQTILIVDLNKVQEINDTKGYEEGDKQIKAAANILIRTQLDNSDIIRTDGNEFVVYLVGYNQKQITNYIHKLNKEFKNLPYDYGAEFGYSMKIDEIKTIEDALNEATKVLKKQKEVNENKD